VYAGISGKHFQFFSTIRQSALKLPLAWGLLFGLNGLALFPRAKEVTMTASAALTNPESAARSLLQMVLAHLSPRREFAVQLWNGEQWHRRQSQSSMVRLFSILLILDQSESEQNDDWAERGVDF
jgi:hypothetical protein